MEGVPEPLLGEEAHRFHVVAVNTSGLPGAGYYRSSESSLRTPIVVACGASARVNDAQMETVSICMFPSAHRSGA